jgi:hypothetical protein
MSEYKFQDDLDPKTHRPRHLHTLGGKPLTGTSEVLKVIAKPLTWWAVGEGLKLLGWTPITEYVNGKPRTVKFEDRLELVKEMFVAIQSMFAEDYLKLLDTAYRAHDTKKNKAAKGGKDMHAELESYVKSCIDVGGKPIKPKEAFEQVHQFADWAHENVEKFLWSELYTYSEQYWLGGITDCGALLKNGKTAIIDFKSSKAAYAEQFYQIGGYAIELAETGGFTASGEKVFDPIEVDTFIIIPFGAPTFEPKIIHDEKGTVREAFLAALTLYRCNQNFE